jgi:hypothetical protein
MLSLRNLTFVFREMREKGKNFSGADVLAYAYSVPPMEKIPPRKNFPQRGFFTRVGR